MKYLTTLVIAFFALNAQAQVFVTELRDSTGLDGKVYIYEARVVDTVATEAVYESYKVKIRAEFEAKIARDSAYIVANGIDANSLGSNIFFLFFSI